MTEISATEQARTLFAVNSPAGGDDWLAKPWRESGSRDSLVPVGRLPADLLQSLRLQRLTRQGQALPPVAQG